MLRHILLRLIRHCGNVGAQKKSPPNWEGSAVRTGLEPATPGVTGPYSNQLNYRTKISKRLF